MNTGCGREWTRQHIASIFTAAFVNKKLKKHREQLLYDIERALLPATQPVVERMIKVEEQEQKMIDIHRQLYELNMQKQQLRSDIYRLRNGTQPVERSEFVRGCPDPDCRGFLSTQWKCGLCQKWSCPDCHEVKGLVRDVEHVCNADTLATARLLSADTKPCPKCQTSIFKIDGCNQMWCTQCHTAFDWRTGRVQEAVHNPHYFEWLRRNGNAIPRTPGDVPCQQALTHTTFTAIRNLLRVRHVMHAFSDVCERMMSAIIRNTIHLVHVIIIPFREQNHVQRNEYFRIQYMRQRITEEQFKVKLQQTEKRVNKNREIFHILDVLQSTVTDIVFRFYSHLETSAAGQWNMDLFDEFDPIVDYTNACLADISKTYGCKRIAFSNEIRQVL